MYPFRIEPFLTSFYLGISVAILAAAGLLVGMRGSIALLIVVGLSGLIAIGEHAPLLRLLYDVGVFRAVRYPEKFVLTCALAVVVWAALVLDRLLAGDSKLATTVSIVAVASTLAALIVWIAQPHVDSRSYLAMTTARAVVALILLPRVGRDRRWATVAVAASAIDVWSATRDVVPRMPRRYFDPPPLAQRFRGDPHAGRIFPDASWEWWDQSGTSYQYFGNRTVEQYWWLFRNGGFPNLPGSWNRELAIENDVDLTSLRTTDDFRDEVGTIHSHSGRR